MCVRNPLRVKAFALSTQAQQALCFAELSQSPSPCEGFCTLNASFTPYPKAFEHVCIFQNPVPVMENETSTLKHTPLNVRSAQEALKHVCMFENPLPVMENETYRLKHTRLTTSYF